MTLNWGVWVKEELDAAAGEEAGSAGRLLRPRIAAKQAQEHRDGWARRLLLSTYMATEGTITMTTTKTMATYPSLRHWPFPCLSLFLSLCSLPLQPCSASRRVSLLLHSFKSLLHTLLAFPLCPLRCYAFLLKFSPSVSHTTGSHCLRRNHGIARILCWFRFRRRSHPGRTLSTVHLVLE